jgi:hypothetical protein
MYARGMPSISLCLDGPSAGQFNWGNRPRNTRGEIHPINGIIQAGVESSLAEIFEPPVMRAGKEEGVRVQINSDKNISVDTRVIQFVRGETNRCLKRFAGKLTRVEVHLSDVNSRKFGI